MHNPLRPHHIYLMKAGAVILLCLGVGQCVWEAL